MALYRRGQVWWIDVTTPGGQRVRRSAETTDKVAATEYHDRVKAEGWRVGKLGERPQRTWQEAVVRWLKEQSHKASIEVDRMHLRWLDPHLSGRYLEDIDHATIDRVTALRLEDGVSKAAVNRVLEVLRAILRHARSALDRSESFSGHAARDHIGVG